MLPRPPSARQRPADASVTVIGVGIDTSRYGHYAAFLGPGLAGATFTVSCGDTQRNKSYRVAVYGHQKSDPVEARACARYALTERPTASPAVAPEFVPLRQVAGRLQAVVRQRTRLVNQLHQLLAP